MQSLRNLFNWSPPTVHETQHEATRNPTVSPQLQSSVTGQPIRSSVTSSEQCIGHPMQRELFVSPERSNIEHRQRPMIKHDEVESCPPMLAQSKLPQPKTVMEGNEKARTRTTLSSSVMQNADELRDKGMRTSSQQTVLDEVRPDKVKPETRYEERSQDK